MRQYLCCDERRRSAVLAHATLNGIDFLEVSDVDTDPIDIRQRVLAIHFLKPLTTSLTPGNFRIEGGERIRNIVVTDVNQPGMSSPPASPPSPADVVELTVSTAGDFSTYTLRVVTDASNSRPPAWLDPILSAIDFSFKVACPSDFDCADNRICPPEQRPAPDINYLTKDYASFRQLLLDRLSVLVPDWTERSPADLGIMLVELLAYLGDRLSYEQDARHTEAYLNTARSRISVRRHARLVDYVLHDGASARVWAQIVVREGTAGVTVRPSFGGFRTQLLTTTFASTPVMRAGSSIHHDALLAGPTVFELLDGVELDASHNTMQFYDWGDAECCLPKGATKATLRGALPSLTPGMILILGERVGPATGDPADADPLHRHPVKLTGVEVTDDPLGGRFLDSPSDDPVPVTLIEWGSDDALPFPLCISARSESGLQSNVSVAWGNIVLADHGRTFNPELLPRVPEPDPALIQVRAQSARCEQRDPVFTPVRYRPILQQEPLTQATPYDPANPPVSAALATITNAQVAKPEIMLTDTALLLDWNPVRDLLASNADAREFVVEIESDGRTRLRFGDDQFGSRPRAYTQFSAVYRVGNGPAGNIGAESLAHIVSADPDISSEVGLDALVRRVWNPLPASGGIAPETIGEARQNAPEAFRTQERAVTEQDYADKALLVRPDAQRAAATFRWTGSWHTVFLTADRFQGRPVDTPFETALRAGLERFRMAGHDLEVDAPRPVPIELRLSVCLKPNYFAADVERDLLELLGSGLTRNGRRALFHPDNYTFGQPVFLSPILAAAHTVAGVASVNATRFRRQGQPLTCAITTGRLDIGRLEIAQLENDPNFPERGVARVTVHEAVL